MNRRKFLASAAATLAAERSASAAFLRGSHGGAVATPPPATGLTAEITFPGNVPSGGPFVFDIANGTNLGNYVAPSAGFTQQCVRVRHASLANFFVDFRPDVSGGKIEVVFWNGECMGTVPTGKTPNNFAAYNAVIKNNGTPVADYRGVTTQAIAFHNWGTRWRFRTAVRPLIRTAAQVFSGGFLPAMSTAAARLSGYSGVIVPTVPLIPDTSNHRGTNGDGSPLTIEATPYVSSGAVYIPFMLQSVSSGNLMGIDCAGDNGGARPEIGLITEWQAFWLLANNLDCLNVMMQQAEFMSGQANGIFIPDQVAGGPVNQKSDVTHYNTAMGLSVGVGSYDIKKGNGEYISKGDEHSPQCWYLPWVVTEDPYYIEGQQFHENYATMSNAFLKFSTRLGNLTPDPTGQTGVNGAFTVYAYPANGEDRALGWALKNVASAWVMSPTSPPSWLLPKSYWAAFSSDYSAVIDHNIALSPSDPYYTVFHSISFDPIGDTPQTFYKAYCSYDMAFADLVGLPVPAAAGKSAPSTWLAQLVWLFDFIRQTCDSSLNSGWNVQNATIHDLPDPIQISNSVATSGCTVGSSGVAPQGRNCWLTYADFYTAMGAFLSTNAPFPNNPSPGSIGTGVGNVELTLAAAAAAKSRGVTGAAAVKTFLDSMVDYSYPQYGTTFHAQNGISGA